MRGLALVSPLPKALSASSGAVVHGFAFMEGDDLEDGTNQYIAIAPSIPRGCPANSRIETDAVGEVWRTHQLVP